MNTAEFVQVLARDLDMSQEQTREILRGLSETVRNLLEQGQTVPIYGLATFKTRAVPERRYRNIATGELDVSRAHTTTVAVFPPELRKLRY